MWSPIELVIYGNAQVLYFGGDLQCSAMNGIIDLTYPSLVGDAYLTSHLSGLKLTILVACSSFAKKWSVSSSLAIF